LNIPHIPQYFYLRIPNPFSSVSFSLKTAFIVLKNKRFFHCAYRAHCAHLRGRSLKRNVRVFISGEVFSVSRIAAIDRRNGRGAISSLRILTPFSCVIQPENCFYRPLK
jgi:hypothetical protein